MKKKIILSIAAAAAIMITNPGANKADAAAPCPVPESGKTVFIQGANLSQDQINSLLNKYLKDFNINFNSFENTQTVPQQQPAKKQTAAPVPAQKPAPAPAQKPVSQPKAAPAPQQAQASSQVSAFEQKVVELTNQERAKNGLPALQLDTALSKVAREKSKDMKAKGYFDHNSPTYGSPFDMMKQFGITYRSAGENIAMGQRSPEEVVNAWMNSEGHRKNIMNASFTHIGVGHVAEGNYWTQMFIGK